MLQAVASYASGGQPLALMLQATAHAAEHRAQAQAVAVPLLFEAFADRCYADDGSLLPRSRPGAVHARERMLAQVAQLQRDGTVTTHGGNILELHFDTVCVHGDNPEGVAAIAAIRAGTPIAEATAAFEASLIAAGFASVDYAEVRDAASLEPVATIGAAAARLFVAARIGGTRLIDNMPV